MPASKMDRASGGESFLHVRRIRRYAWILTAVWTLILLTSYIWFYGHQRQGTEAIARTEARAAFARDVLYRRWAASHGGVYVPVTEQTRPNPYLTHIAERDITTARGKTLTLVNPAYMTRQVYELAQKQENVGRGHITSLDPLRPENKPDLWEATALKAFEQGVQEVFEVQELEGKPYMRLIRPFFTDAACLKCHAVQGYHVGDIRGGISVSIPIQSLQDAARVEVAGLAITYGALWILGVGMIGFGARSFTSSSRSLEESELRYRTVAEFTSEWEYWSSPDGTFRYISPACEQISGYAPDEFLADPLLLKSIIHPDDQKLFEGHSHNLSSQGIPEPIDFRIRTKNGELRWISHACRTVYDSSGQTLGQRASNRDITDRKVAEEEIHLQAAMLEEEVAERQATQEELALKQQQLEQLNKSLENRITETVDEMRHKDQILIQQGRLAAMGEMIHNIAHQWRQPLNNVGLIIQNLQLSYLTDSLTSAEMDKEVTNAMGILMHMSRTIDDFRNFFRPDKEKHSFAVKDSVDHTLEFIGATLENSNIQVEVLATGEVFVLGYENEYAQVLLNILGNARDVLVERKIAAPSITITIGAENGHSLVIIRDNGGGIDEDVMPKIFDPYFTTKEQGKGSGIGLFMSKAIIEQNMNGSLTAHTVNGGVEFRVAV